MRGRDDTQPQCCSPLPVLGWGPVLQSPSNELLSHPSAPDSAAQSTAHGTQCLPGHQRSFQAQNSHLSLGVGVAHPGSGQGLGPSTLTPGRSHTLVQHLEQRPDALLLNSLPDP